MAAAGGGGPTGRELREIAPGIWCWQRRPRGLRPGEFGARTSYALIAGGETLLVDPLVTGEDDPALGVLDGLASATCRRWSPWPSSGPSMCSSRTASLCSRATPGSAPSGERRPVAGPRRRTGASRLVRA